MTARIITRSAATAALGAGLSFTSISAAHAAPSHPAARTTTVKGTAFVTADGTIACAYNRRGVPHTECLNTTSGWKHLKHGGLRDVDGHLISDHPFLVKVTNKFGVGLPEVSTQGPTFDSVTAQKWHAKTGPVKHVRITTNGYGDYVNQNFAVLKPGQNLTFPDGISFLVTADGIVQATTHPRAGSSSFTSITAKGYGPSDN